MAGRWFRVLTLVSIATLSTSVPQGFRMKPVESKTTFTPSSNTASTMKFPTYTAKASGRSSGSSTAAAQRTELLLGLITTMTYPPNMELAEGRKISGAMTLAVDAVNADPTILPAHRLNYVVGDDKGTEENSAVALTEQWEQDVVGVFGPEDTCEAAGYMAELWNLPILGYKCSDPSLSDKIQYPTFARTQPSASEAARFILALLQHYNWFKFSIFVEQIEGFPGAGAELRHLAKARDYTVHHYVSISGPFSSLFDKPVLDDAINRTYQETRIYVVLGRFNLLQSFVQHLQELGLSETGEYAVIGFLDDRPYTESYGANLIFPPSQFTDQRGEAQTRSFENVLILSNPPASNPNYAKWEEAVTDKLYEPPINFPRNPFLSFLSVKTEVPISAAHLYDSVLIYARALHEVVMSGGQVTDGSAILDQMVDKVYPSILGHNFYMDRNGDTEGNYVVLGLQPMQTPTGTGMKPIGGFMRDSINRRKLTFMPSIDLFGGQPPLDGLARCGGLGLRCVFGRRQAGSSGQTNI